MKKLNTKILALVLGSSLFLSSCDTVKNANNTQKGAAIGVVAGSVLGGVLGNNLGKGGNGALGAVIGAAVGGAAGGVIGNKMDKQAAKIEETLPGATVVRSDEGIQVILDENSNVKFDYNKATLTSAAQANLDKLIEIFKEYPDTNLTVFGYTDSVGSDAYNLNLSSQRAKSVSDYLISKGIASSRLSTTGMGKADPRASNDTDAGRAQNRRVEFAITANQKMVDEAKQEAGK